VVVLRLEKHYKTSSDSREIHFKLLKDVMVKPITEKYLKHARQNPLIRFFDVKRTLVAMPVCMKCERICTYDRQPGDPPVRIYNDPEFGIPVKEKPYVTCFFCGYHGPGGPPALVHCREV
jgi:hypothetical protein